MILHQDGLIVLRYDIKTDVLFVKWPDIRDTPAAVIEYSFSKLIDAIKHYNITKLLINSKQTVYDVNDVQTKALSIKLGLDLAATRITKVARIISDDAKREIIAQEHLKDVKSQITLNFVSKDFLDEASALAWLLGKENA